MDSHGTKIKTIKAETARLGFSSQKRREQKLNAMPTQQARYWMLTIPANTHWMPCLNATLTWLRGQLEEGAGGYRHWQVVVGAAKKLTLGQLKVHFPNESHCEPTRSDAADEYVWKEESRIPDTQFELGAKSLKRNAPADWDKVWEHAVND